MRMANSEWRIAAATTLISSSPFATRHSLFASFDDHQRLAELDRLTVLDQDLDDGAAARSRNLIHGLHGFDDEQRLARAHAAADLDERTCAGLRPHIGG